MRIFVTGGTGLLGNTILRQLALANESSVALVRGKPDPQVFEGIPCEFVSGDLEDKTLLANAIQNCDSVIHSAGLIHLGWKRLDESMRVNRDASATIADLCLRHHKKLVHVGTLNAMAVGTPDNIPDESTPRDANGGQIPSSYVVSKQAGVDAVLERVPQGLNAIIVHPGFMLGPWDWKPSSGRMMVEVGKAWRPVAPAGGCSLCDVRDVAAATIQATVRDLPSGRQYILAGHNWTYLQLWTEMARRYKRRPPLAKVGPVPRWIAATVGDLVSRFTKNESDLNSAAIKMSSQYHWGNSQRAIDELGYQIRPAHETLDDAAKWLQRASASTF
jgi:dihydroflavonol-4-reductase